MKEEGAECDDADCDEYDQAPAHPVRQMPSEEGEPYERYERGKPRQPECERIMGDCVQLITERDFLYEERYREQEYGGDEIAVRRVTQRCVRVANALIRTDRWFLSRDLSVRRRFPARWFRLPTAIAPGAVQNQPAIARVWKLN